MEDQLNGKPVTWVVVADGEHARILAPVKGPKMWSSIRALDSAEAHKRSSDLGSDAPGRDFESAPATSTRHAIAPRQDLHRMAKERFAGTVARVIDEAALAGEFDRVAIVAPGRTLADIRANLSPAATGRLIGCLAKDLTRIPDEQIGSHLSWELLHGGTAAAR